LFQNSPNPVSDQTTVSYELNEKANVSFAIYDISGKKVYTREMGNQNSGMHKIDLNVKNAGLTGGFYTYTLTVNNQVTANKMIVNP
jgi:flagellar hook assembly protein FlgD